MDMPAQNPAPIPGLAELRREIDRIDLGMHELLMERGRIIERLIETKKTGESGSAFRPDREASMMRAMAERHGGLLPLDTVESIWRVIIGTFTYVQAPYAVHADISGGDAPMRDSARFHFGFTVPYRSHPDAAAVVSAVARSRGDLGIARIDQGATAGAWWTALAEAGGPKIIARLPFIERPDHPAGTPVFVVSKPLSGPGARDTILYAARFERWREENGPAIEAIGGEVIASAGIRNGLSVLLAAPASLATSEVVAAFAATGAPPSGVVEIGSHAERFRVKS
jgi:chorismate mutase